MSEVPDGLTEEMVALDIYEAMLVESVGAGWAEPMNDNGEVPEGGGPIFMLTVEYRKGEDIDRDGNDSELRKAFLALSPPAVSELIMVMTNALLTQPEGGEIYE